MHLDALKCFAMFLVLWGHCIMHLSDVRPLENGAYHWIASFHMPLFMGLVGYFSISSLRYGLKDFVVHKTRQLILPPVLWTVGWIVVLWIVSSLLDISLSDGKGLNHLVFNLWFLKSAFCCFLLFYPCFKYIKGFWTGVVISLLLSQAFPVFKVNFMFPCFLAGVILRRYESSWAPHSIAIMISALVVYLVSYILTPLDLYSGMPEIKDRLVHRDFHALSDLATMQSARIIMGVSGFVFFVCLFRLVEEKGWFRDAMSRFAEMGKHTLTIYIIQSFLLEELMSRYVDLTGMDLIVFTFVFCPVVSWMLLYLFYKVGSSLESDGSLVFRILVGK